MQVTLAKKGNAYEKTKLNCRFQHRVSAGLGPTKLNIDTEYETTESSSGGAIGYEAIQKLNDKQGISFGVELNSINSDHLYNDSETVFDYETNTIWLTFPMLYRYVALEKVSLLGGAYLASALKREAKIGSVSIDADNVIESLDYGLVIGAEYAFSKQIFANAQFRLGLADLNKVAGSSEMKITQFRLSAGYAF